VFRLVIERSRMSSWPPRLDVRDYGIFNAVAFFEALLINREMVIDMLRRQVPAEGVPSPRAQEFLEGSEWDLMDLVSLRCLCNVGTYRGVVETVGDNNPRFCGKGSS
jgi:hypothetical protein